MLGELGGEHGAVVDADKPAAVDEQAPSHGAAPIGYAAGYLFDALHGDLLSDALGAVSAARDPAGRDAEVRGGLTDGQEAVQAAVAPEPALAAGLDEVGVGAAAVGAFAWSWS